MTDHETNEISRIHDRLNDLVKIQNKQAIDIARLALAAEFERDAHKRPCSDHEALKEVVANHLNDLAESKYVWKSAWVRSAVHVVELAVVGAFVWWLGKK